MKIVIPGGSGQIGTILARHFHAAGHEVVVLSRSPTAQMVWRVVPWEVPSAKPEGFARTRGAWANEFDGADVVINLAGRSVNCRYTRANRREILESRVRSTQIVGEAIGACARPPRLWLQSSTATIYAHRFDAPNDERTGVLGGNEPDAPETWRFGIAVAAAWEDALGAADTPRTRKVALRSAMTMSPDRGGVFDVLLGLVRRGLGGRAGAGTQFVSWVHEADFIAAVEFLIGHDELSGPVNVCAPEPLPNAEFMRALRAAWGVRFGLPAAGWMVGLGAWAMRTESELVLKSRRVVPGRLLDAGFAFRFPSWPGAARDLCQRWRDRRAAR
ncbi:MAG: TIGR01777 family oxidoreductase [Planctomycetes bacterium]|nr:TIGR01777 family oxidoreductase [Planctomycetota bacterium]